MKATVSALSRLDSDRLVLRRSDAVPLPALADFFARNVTHLQRWLPEARPIVDSPGFRDALLEHVAAGLAAGVEERWFASPRGELDRVVGYVFLTRFERDGHQSCELAYGIDAALTGQGLMTEALQCALRHARETLGFTCTNARYDVDNHASARLLQRLGFVPIGVAPAHAWLAGAWRDHVLVTRVDREGPPTNPQTRPLTGTAAP